MDLDEKIDALCSEVQGIKKHVTDPRRTAPPNNGLAKIIIGVVVALVIGVISAGTGMVLSHDSSIAVIDARTKDITSERVGKIETKYEALEKDVAEVTQETKTANSKLDALLGRFNVKVPE